MTSRRTVEDLARELRMDPVETVALCQSLGLPIVSKATRLRDDQADQVRSAAVDRLTASRSARPSRSTTDKAPKPRKRGKRPTSHSAPSSPGVKTHRSGTGERPLPSVRREQQIPPRPIPPPPERAKDSLRSVARSLALDSDQLAQLANRVGIRATDLDAPLGSIGSARAKREVEAIQRARASEQQRWDEHGVRPESIESWRAHGFDDPQNVAVWVTHGIGPTAAGAWTAREFRNASDVAALLDHGATLAEVDRYIERGGGPACVMQWVLTGDPSHQIWPSRYTWCAAGLAPSIASEWFISHFAPRTAASLHNAGLSPTDAVMHRDAGLRIDRMVEFVDRGMSTRDAFKWLAFEIDGDNALPWWRAGIQPAEAAQWRKSHVNDPAEAASWREAVGAYSEAEPWIRVNWSDPEDAAPWHHAGLTPRQALNWSSVGIRHAPTAAALRGRIRLDDTESLLDAGFSNAELRTFAAHRTEAKVLQLLAKTVAKDTTALRRWRSSTNPVEHWPRWMIVFPDEPQRVARWRVAGLDPLVVKRLARRHRLRFVELGDLLASGLPKDVAIRRLTEPTPDVEAPAVAEPDAFDAWLNDGDIWIDRARARRVGGERLLRELHGRQRLWATGEPVFEQCANGGPSSNWLEEVLAHAENVQDQLRRAPVWPMIYEGDDVTVDLTVFGGLALAWVGTPEGGIVVTFSTTTFDVWCNLAQLDSRLAAGLAVSWFIDCCISLSETTSHPHLERRRSAPSTSPKRSGGSVYGPTSRFRQHRRSIERGHTLPPRAHRVSGHIRTLPSHMTPTAEARHNAPAHVRLAMGDQDTFVRAHQRGGDEAAQRLIRRLNSYSSLADALGTAQIL